MHARPSLSESAPSPAALAERGRAAREMLRACELCEWRCGVDRLGGERGKCRLTSDARVYKRYLSFNDEPEVSPAYRLFLGACNFRCSFCDEAPHAFDPHAGEPVSAAGPAGGALAAELRRAARRGARSINVLGGEPTLHVDALLAIARAAGGRLPLAVSTNMYMTPEVLTLLRGVVRWYLADFKFGADACAERVAAIPDYTRIVRRNLRLAAAHSEVIVRHVLLPGHLECCLRPIVAWLSGRLPGIRFQLYTGFVPVGPAAKDPLLGRLNTRDDVQRAVSILRSGSLRWQTPPLDLRTASGAAVCRSAGSNGSCGPGDSADSGGSASVTIGRDGRLYCHDVSAELLPVLRRLTEREAAGAAARGRALPVVGVGS